MAELHLIRLRHFGVFRFGNGLFLQNAVMIEKNVINRTVAKDVFEAVFKEDVDPERYVEEHGLKVVNDTDALTKTIEELLEKNPQSVADFKAGKEKAMGFIVGQTMRAMKGKADPAVVNQLVRERMSR